MDVWFADTTTLELTPLTDIGEDDPYVAWSPDEKRLVFIASGGLYELATDGTGLVRIGEGWFDGQVAVAPD